MGLLLNILASALFALFGFATEVLTTLYLLIFKGYGNSDGYQLQLAKSKDQHGNVVMQWLFNFLFIKKDGYKFGNPDDTISYVIGVNKLNHTLSYWGMVLDGILEFFDPGHSLAAAGLKMKISFSPKWYLNKTFWLKAFIAIAIVFGIIYQFPNCDWAIYPVFVAFGYCAGIGIIMIVYAWIINPIRLIKEKLNK